MPRTDAGTVYRINHSAVIKHLREQTEPFTLEEIAMQTAFLAKRIGEDDT